MNVSPELYKKLAAHPNIVGVKEADGNVNKLVKSLALCGDDLAFYAGDDDVIAPFIALGAVGAVSVLSNLFPSFVVDLTGRAISGDETGAITMQTSVNGLIAALFSEVNPIPIKYAMSKAGFIENELRLPLTPLTDKNRLVLDEEIKAFRGNYK